MRKVRTDLVGVVLAAGRNFAAGEAVPDDVTIHASLLEDAEPAQAAENALESDEKPAQAAENAPESDEKPDEDYSDLLGDEDAEKAAPKRSARRTSTRKS